MNRRHFLKAASGLFVPIAFPSIVRSQSVMLPGSGAAWGKGGSGGGGTPNNIALVGTNKGGSQVAGGASTINIVPSSVTNGNNVIVGIAALGAAISFTTGMLTKTAGASTIGTIVLDKALNAASGATIGLAKYRVPVTGSGTLTLTFNPGAGTWAFLEEFGEYSGMAASPVDAGGSGTGSGTSSGSGLAQGETTGSVSSSNVGMISYIASEGSGINWTRSESDLVTFNDSNGASDMTGVGQYKLISASPNTLQSSVEATSISWWACWVSYKST